MGLRINTNVPSISAQRQLGVNQKRLTHAQQAIASGSRIVNAADDAAGLSISENIRGQLGGIKQARNNAFNAQSVVQISEGGLNEISNILIRLRELGVQAASDTVSDVERAFLDTEAQQLIEEADRIAKTTRFGNKQLLDGNSEELEFHVGPFAGDENVVRFNLEADATASTLGIDGLAVGDKGDARSTLEAVDEAIVQIGKMRSDFGAVQSRLNSTINNLDIQNENLSAARSRINDADIAHESAEIASASILNQASVGVLAQANQNGGAALRLIG
ncbi:MAG: flagellin FliC [Bdellovibrionaceae bacterium]|nr:flagellin FliC [Pseudobdellovibrionaceae bacterium]